MMSAEKKLLRDLVNGQTIGQVEKFTLESGKELKNIPVAYKTWGKLNEKRDNCMVICHALSGSCDVEDWWGPLIGPGRTFDTSRFFIFCGNVLGSPYGTYSPCSLDQTTGKMIGPNFPLTTIRDDVRLHKLILDQLNVESVRFCIGGSMGGMQVLEWAFFGKEYVQNIVPIATSGRHSAWCISWGETQRQSIFSDPKYLQGNYDMSDPPVSGLSAARMAAMLTYRSRNSFEARFGRKVMPKKKDLDIAEQEKLQHNDGNKYSLHEKGNPLVKDVHDKEFAVYSAQSYLRYKGDCFVNRFDANCYIAITRKLDTHDVSRGRGEYNEVLNSINQPCFIIGVDSDGLFTVEEQHELANNIPNSRLTIIQSGEGHDGFLLEFQQMRDLLSGFIEQYSGDLPVQTGLEKQVLESKPSVFGEAEDELEDCIDIKLGNQLRTIKPIFKLDLISQIGKIATEIRGYACLNSGLEAEEAHWPNFWNHSIQYLAEKSDDWEGRDGFLSFLLGVISHGVSDVLWHSLGIDQGFIAAMKYAFYDGDYAASHIDADFGGEFVLSKLENLDYLQIYWQIPTQDLIEVYKRMNYTISYGKLNLCMMQGLVALQANKLIGKYMLPIVAWKSPFLNEQIFKYFRGGIHSMALSVAECWKETFGWVQRGRMDTQCKHMGYAYTEHIVQYSNSQTEISDCIKSNAQNLGIVEHFDGTTTLRTNSLSTLVNLYCSFKYDTLKIKSKEITILDRPLVKHVYSFFNSIYQHLRRWVQKPCENIPSNVTILDTKVDYSMLGSSMIQGDFNADKQNDLVIGAPGYSRNGSPLSGAVFYIKGGATLINYKGPIEDISEMIYGPDEGGIQFGYSVTSVDLNCDGVDDLAISAPYVGAQLDRYDGAIYVLFGSKTGFRKDGQFDLIIKSNNDEQAPYTVLGQALKGIDLDNDGCKDLLIGSPFESSLELAQKGSLRAFLSKSSHIGHKEISEADWIIYGDQEYEWFGSDFAISNSILVVSSPGYCKYGTSKSAGKISMFNLSSSHIPQEYMQVANNLDYSQFGKAVENIAFDGGNMIVVGAPSHTVNEATSTFMNLPGILTPLEMKGYQTGQIQMYNTSNLNAGPISTITGVGSLGHFGSFITSSYNQLIVSEPYIDGERGNLYIIPINNLEFGSKCIKSVFSRCFQGSTLERFGDGEILEFENYLVVPSRNAKSNPFVSWSGGTEAGKVTIIYT